MRRDFTKMNGAGNDFVVMDNRDHTLHLTEQNIVDLCDRHRGVGADGVLLVESPDGEADLRMRYYNSDGREAEMCGNGARCFARYAARLLPGDPAQLSFTTPAGIIRATLEGELVTVTMSGASDYRDPQWLNIGDKVCVHFINTGVPHAVVFVADTEAVPLTEWGAALRGHEDFAPRGTNANFAQVLSAQLLRLRTYERGVEAETLACGTGVCAAALLHHIATGASSPISVSVRGGETLRVGFAGEVGNFESVTLTGPADFVFDGTISL